MGQAVWRVKITEEDIFKSSNGLDRKNYTIPASAKQCRFFQATVLDTGKRSVYYVLGSGRHRNILTTMFDTKPPLRVLDDCGYVRLFNSGNSGFGYIIP